MALNRILNLIFKADTADAEAGIKRVKGETDGEGIQGLNSALDALIALNAIEHIERLGRIVVEKINAWREWAVSVDNLASTIGTTTEEASVLSRLMADFDISAGAMSSAMQTMARNGLEPSIEGLIEVRRQLNATTSEAERLALAQKLLGDQGVNSLIPMLDQLTNQELRDFIDGMDEATILTEEEAEKAQVQQVAVNEMKSAWGAFALEFGNWIAPAITTGLQIMTGDFEALTVAELLALAKLRAIDEAMRATVDTMNEANPELLKHQAFVQGLTGAYDDLAAAAHQAAGRGVPTTQGGGRLPASMAAGRGSGLGAAGAASIVEEAETVRRYYGGGGGGGFSQAVTKDLLEILEDIDETLKSLPDMIADAVERSGGGLR